MLHFPVNCVHSNVIFCTFFLFLFPFVWSDEEWLRISCCLGAVIDNLSGHLLQIVLEFCFIFIF